MYCRKWLKHPCAQQPLFFGFFLLSFLVLFHFTTFLLNDFRHLTPMLAFLLTGFGALVHLSYTLGRYQSLGPMHSLSYWRNYFHCTFWTIGFLYFIHCSGKRISSQASTTLVDNIHIFLRKSFVSHALKVFFPFINTDHIDSTLLKLGKK